MKKIVGLLFWSAVFVLLLLGMDQVLLRTSLEAPGLREVQVFYRDFRHRLLQLPQNPPAGGEAPAPGRPPVVPPQKKGAPSPVPPVTYVYADASGNLQFAESLAEVPAPFRSAAKPLQP